MYCGLWKMTHLDSRNLKEKSLTRRRVLSALSLIYNPLGFGAQKLCQLNLKLDEDIPDEISNEWLAWKENVPNLEMVHLGRCFKPHGFGKVVDCSLHHFPDTCEMVMAKLVTFAL